jgi:5-formyltetrahydrofolate cyclo-ligase
MTEHDIPLTAIVTPNEFIEMDRRLKRPKGIYWNILPDEKIEAIPVLKRRRSNLV